ADGLAVPKELAAGLEGWLAARPQAWSGAGALNDAESWSPDHAPARDPGPALLTSTASGTSTPTVSLVEATPSAEAKPLPNPAVPAQAAAAPTRHVPFSERRRRFPWPLGIAASAIVGLATAL